MTPYQALIVVSFGGPEGPDDVMPFLENVLRGKNVPRERMEEVAEHYQHFNGVSPINEQNRNLIAELQKALARHEIELPIYFGNRNWYPTIDEALAQMKADGIQKALAFFTSAYSCYSGCRQYRENIQVAREKLGDAAPEIHKLRMFFNHPMFVEACAIGYASNSTRSSHRGGHKHDSSSPPTASRCRWPRDATTRPNCGKPVAWWPNRWETSPGIWFTKVVPGLHRNLGWNPMFAIF